MMQNPLVEKFKSETHYTTPSKRKEIKDYMQRSAVPLFRTPSTPVAKETKKFDPLSALSRTIHTDVKKAFYDNMKYALSQQVNLSKSQPKNHYTLGHDPGKHNDMKKQPLASVVGEELKKRCSQTLMANNKTFLEY